MAQQYAGRLGATTNCQVAVSLSLANAAASLPVAWRLYLPEAWAADHERCRAAGVPLGVGFQTKLEIALEQLGAAVRLDLPRGVVLADEAYGRATSFRDGVRALGLDYAVAIDRAQSLLLDDGKGPLAASAVAHRLPKTAWRTVPERPAGLRYAALRVRAAPHGRPGPEEWLLCERGRGRAAEERFWLASLPAETGLGELVTTTTLRWRIERDVSRGPHAIPIAWGWEELKQEVGLGHFEGRGPRWPPGHRPFGDGSAGLLAADGAASTTMPACASQPTASWSGNAVFSPLRQGAATLVPATPMRPQRHNPASIASLRLALLKRLIQRLPCCPWCGSTRPRPRPTPPSQLKAGP